MSSIKDVKIRSPVEKCVFPSVSRFRDARLFMDLEIRCGLSPKSSAPVICHKLILALASPMFFDILRDYDDIEDRTVVYLPDVLTENMQKFVDDLYHNLSLIDTDMEQMPILMDPVVATCLGLNYDYRKMRRLRRSELKPGNVTGRLSVPKMNQANQEAFEMFGDDDFDNFGPGEFNLNAEQLSSVNGNIPMINYNPDKDGMKLELPVEIKLEENTDEIQEDVRKNKRRKSKTSAKHKITFVTNKKGKKTKKSVKSEPQDILDEMSFITEEEMIEEELKREIEKDRMKAEALSPDEDYEIDHEDYEMERTDNLSHYYFVPKKRPYNKKSDKDDDSDAEKKDANNASEPKRKRKKKEKLEPQPDSSEDEDVDESLQCCYDVFKEHNDVIKLNMEPIPFNDCHLGHKKPRSTRKERLMKLQYAHILKRGKAMRMYVLACKNDEGLNNFKCRPITSSFMKKKHILKQFDSTFDLIKHLYGTSDYEMYLGKKIIKRTRVNSQKIAIDKELKEKFKKMNSEELQQALTEANRDVEKLMSKGEKHAKLEVEVGEKATLTLMKDMDFNECDGLMVLWYYKSANKPFTCWKIQIDEPSFWSSFLIDLWENPPVNKYIVWKSRTIHSKFKKAFEISRRPEIIESMMQEAQLKQLEASKVVEKTTICPDCGKIFPIESKADKSHYAQHCKNHEWMNFKCECDVVLLTVTAKMKHYQLVHSGRDYVKCDLCKYTCRSESLQNHMDNHHRTYVCNFCGYNALDLSKYQSHMSYFHEPFTCDVCQEVIQGKQAFKRHKRTKHPTKHRCDICGAEFNLEIKVRNHKIRVHTADSDKPNVCKLCGKGFYDPQTLKNHMTNIHIKNRPHKCRYGCGMDYNDPSNRRQHEKKKHGQIFQSN